MSTTILGAPSPIITDQLAHAHNRAPLTPPSSHKSSSHQQHYHYYMNPSPPIQYTHTQPHHGTKRSAPDDEIESPANNISTHFKKLRLNQTQAQAQAQAQAHLPPPTTLSQVGVSLRANNNNNTHNHVDSHNSTAIPPHNDHASTYQNDTPMHQSHHHYHQHQLQHQHYDNEAQIQPPQATDFMSLDETPNRIYIHDLESEIAAIEALEPKNLKTTFLLPDFDKNVSRIPQNVLRSRFDASVDHGLGGGGGESQALVLYRDPVSISVPPEEDVVRKAIIESRRLAREKIRREYEEQVRSHTSNEQGDVHHDMGAGGGVTGVLHTIHEVPSHDDEVIDVEENMHDPDAMDIE